LTGKRAQGFLRASAGYLFNPESSPARKVKSAGSVQLPIPKTKRKKCRITSSNGSINKVWEGFDQQSLFVFQQNKK